jgi:hypothetical protein
MAALGRWGQVDPLADQYAGHSPYNYVLGNPNSFVDPDGRAVTRAANACCLDLRVGIEGATAALPLWDDVSEARSQQLVQPVRAQARLMLNRASLQGMSLRIVQGFRSVEEQDALYAQGRTEPGSVVTNARGGDSFHNYGVAFDVVEIRDGRPLWSEESGADWDRIGEIGESAGLEWGGRWSTFIDKPHFQNTGGRSLAEFKDALQGGTPPAIKKQDGDDPLPTSR